MLQILNFYIKTVLFRTYFFRWKISISDLPPKLNNTFENTWAWVQLLWAGTNGYFWKFQRQFKSYSYQIKNIALNAIWARYAVRNIRIIWEIEYYPRKLFKKFWKWKIDYFKKHLFSLWFGINNPGRILWSTRSEWDNGEIWFFFMVRYLLVRTIPKLISWLERQKELKIGQTGKKKTWLMWKTSIFFVIR